MILSGVAISQAVEAGHIRISPFDDAQLNPVSYDLRLGSKVLVYRPADGVIDTKLSQHFEVQGIHPERGFVVLPGHLYLMHTIETIWSDRYVPIIDGKSSTGRLGLGLHVTAGFGDPGFDGQYTLEVWSVEHAVRLYVGMRIGQVRFHGIAGTEGMQLYRGNYTHGSAMGPVASACWRQFHAAPGAKNG